ncbi:hypothetical protein D8674_004754 [Pyrus ussuriensis x Pyrus communis]|uniref:NAC domain-containing protein n=1 Tax=Pyrus ussuriensis x Pyrus communis TaxID=2448454 RepID=A0A5N5FQ56_9ROSA|nr:hypothetical protein D8674_004754 [Pyrus ussuriensis x Pyrus communis]
MRFCLGKGIDIPPVVALQSRSIRLVRLSNKTKKKITRTRSRRNGKAIPAQPGAWGTKYFPVSFFSQLQAPADQELINFFLYRKVVLRQPLVPRHVGFVHEIDLLGDHQPWEIWDACGGPQPYGKQAYFFCKLKKLSKSGSEHHHDWYLETYILASIPDDDQAVVAICRLRKNYHKRKRYVPQRNRRRINGRKERHGRRINGQLMETKRQSCSSNFTTDEKLNINDDVATMGCHQCDYINYASGYDHYGATSCNWKDLDAENQMPPQLRLRWLNIIVKTKRRRWPCQLLGWIMVIMDSWELVNVIQVLLGFGPNRWMTLTSLHINIFNSNIQPIKIWMQYSSLILFLRVAIPN